MNSRDHTEADLELYDMILREGGYTDIQLRLAPIYPGGPIKVHIIGSVSIDVIYKAVLITKNPDIECKMCFTYVNYYDRKFNGCLEQGTGVTNCGVKRGLVPDNYLMANWKNIQ